jgi:phospholipase A1/A2
MVLLRGALLGLFTGLAALTNAAGAQAEPLSPYQTCLLREAERAAARDSIGDVRLRCLRENTVAVPPLAAASEPAAAARDPLLALQNILNRPRSELSLFEQRVASEYRASGEPFALLPHRPNYLLPVTQQHLAGSVASAQPRRDLEAQFQVSFKFALTPPLLGNHVLPFFGYTGRSWWQVYRSEQSRPFREYNHEPELFVALPGSQLDFLGWRHRILTVGLNHQSNGRSMPDSRSWNRVIVEAFFDRGASNWASLKLWRRIPERAKRNANDNDGDDNPDITRFIGHTELRLGHVSAGGQNTTLMLRRSFQRSGKGAAQLDWSAPTGYSPSLRFTAQFFDGYGDSLADYNVRLRRIGLGLMLNDWF